MKGNVPLARAVVSAVAVGVCVVTETMRLAMRFSFGYSVQDFVYELLVRSADSSADALGFAKVTDVVIAFWAVAPAAGPIWVEDDQPLAVRAVDGWGLKKGAPGDRDCPSGPGARDLRGYALTGAMVDEEVTFLLTLGEH
jgi:hypothetical protein